MSRHLDSSTTTQMAKIMVQYGRPSRSSWAKSVWSSFGRTVVGKGNLRKSCWSTVRRRFPIRNASSYTVTSDYSDSCMWMTSNWLETNKKIFFRCGKNSIKKLIWENQHLSLIMYSWDVLKDSVLLKWENWKITILGKYSYLVMPRNVWNDIVCANRTTQQLYKVSTTCIDDHHFKEEELISVEELSKVCSQIVLKF